MHASTYKPCYDGPIAGWVMNHVQANLWRVSRVRQREDLMQDAYEVFLRVAKKYPNEDTPQHFMSLFQRSWINHVHDLSNANTRQRAEVGFSRTGSEEAYEWEPSGDTNNDGELAVMLRQAPSEIKMVLSLFLNAPQEILDLALASWRGKDRRCVAGGSARVCRLLGLPEDRDIMQEVADYFGTRP